MWVKVNVYVVCILFLFLEGCTHEKRDYNLTFHNLTLDDFKWRTPEVLYMQVDSSEFINGKYPILFEQKTDTGFVTGKAPLHVEFYQQIVFPSGLKEADPVYISVSNKCHNLSQARFQLYCLNESDSVVYSDTLSLNNDDYWAKRSLLFPVGNAHKIVIGLYALGYSLPEEKALIPQQFWLDRITLTVNGKNIENYSYSLPPINGTIKEKDIYELSVDKNDDWKLVIPPDKKIIGIGESIYGSKTMNHIEMELLKALVESNNCKLIVFELDMYDVFLWNLYIQGIVGNNYLDKIKEYAVNNLLSEEEIVDFLVWLRKYNESKQKKVTIQGMVENNYNTLTNPLFDYVYAFYTDSSIQVIPQLLSYIHQGNISSAINLVRTSRELEELMGTSAFQDLLYGLLQMTRYTQDVEYSVNFHRKRSHDFSMYKNIEKFINQYTEKGETTALVAHASHVSKKGDISLFPNINSVGYYLKWKYGEQYHVIALHTGEGSFSTEATNQDPYLYSVKALTSPPNNSLEQECLKLQKPCFYYSTSSMNKENMFYRSIGNNYLENMEYQYNCFPVHFDGFIFVDKCEPVKTTDINSQTVVPDYRMERTNILKELNN